MESTTSIVFDTSSTNSWCFDKCFNFRQFWRPPSPPISIFQNPWNLYTIFCWPSSYVHTFNSEIFVYILLTFEIVLHFIESRYKFSPYIYISFYPPDTCLIDFKYVIINSFKEYSLSMWQGRHFSWVTDLLRKFRFPIDME